MKATLIIPCWNSAATLPRIIADVRAQTFSDFEAIFVDDGSTDGCAAFAKEICQSSYSTVLRSADLISKKNGGVAEARNVGIAVCDQ